ncbi:MAG TPA: DUF99 family protein [Methanoregulaceae archaeon]|nr:DUF99 family protein [Methanoregulaceae archaeon]
MHIAKKGLRVLGIAESFSSRKESVLAGIVMRKDLRIDGAAYGTATVGGMDATDTIVKLYHSLDRNDINVIMISGCVISWYNIIDPGEVATRVKRPVIAVTYEDSEGLEEDIMRHFPGDTTRLEMYRKLGSRASIDLPTGYTIYIRTWGLSEHDAGRLCREFTYDGKIPEPLRVARICARGVMRYTNGSK